MAILHIRFLDAENIGIRKKKTERVFYYNVVKYSVVSLNLVPSPVTEMKCKFVEKPFNTYEI